MSEANRLISEAIRLLVDANSIADAARAEADRYARRRAAEADLVLQKAQRVLMAAEAKAAAILRAAAGASTEPVATPEVTPDSVIDLDALAAAREPTSARQAPKPTSDLDRLIEAAIGRAVDHAFPLDAAR